MKLTTMAGKVTVPTHPLTITMGGKTEVIECPRLSVGDFREIKAASKKIDEETNVWDILIDIANKAREIDDKNISKKEKKELQDKQGMEMMRRLDHSLQLIMFTASLRRIEDNITEEQVDKIISYGAEDQKEYASALMFLIYGITSEAAQEELDTPLESEEKDKE